MTVQSAADEPTARIAPPDGAESDGPGTRPAPRRARRTVLVVVLGVLVVVLAAAAWLGVRVYQAGRALLAAQDGATTMVQDVRTGDLTALKGVLPTVRDDLHTARRAVDDPVWRAATVLPWAGKQLGAVRTVTVALDDVMTTSGPALDALDGALAAQDAPRTDGRLALRPLVDALPPVLAAADQFDTSSREIAAIDTTALTPRLAAPVTSLQHQLAAVSDTVRSGAQLARLLPGMLGVGGPRSYLLVSLNSAELRAQGGIVGALALLTADDGAVNLVAQHTTSDFPSLAAPILALTPAEEQFQTDRLGRWIQNATLTPDFPRAAQLIAARWEAATGQHVDGVIATDPVAAGELLKATGPVTVTPGTTVDAASLVPALLHDAYVRFPYTDGRNEQADAFYVQVAAAIFRAVGNGQGDRLGVVSALVQAAQEGRVRVWSAHDDEEGRLLASSVGAAFLTGAYPDDAGVFLDDATAGKLDYYLRTTVTVEQMRCSGPDPTATVRLDLSYAPPADVATLPAYVLGVTPQWGHPGRLQTNISVYAPAGAQLDALGLTGTQGGRQVQVVTSRLDPGGQASYRFQVPVRDGQLRVWTTPTLTGSGLVTASCP